MTRAVDFFPWIKHTIKFFVPTPPLSLLPLIFLSVPLSPVCCCYMYYNVHVSAFLWTMKCATSLVPYHSFGIFMWIFCLVIVLHICYSSYAFFKKKIVMKDVPQSVIWWNIYSFICYFLFKKVQKIHTVYTLHGTLSVVHHASITLVLPLRKSSRQLCSLRVSVHRQGTLR